jgi:hypothetical protein
VVNLGQCGPYQVKMPRVRRKKLAEDQAAGHSAEHRAVIVPPVGG